MHAEDRARLCLAIVFGAVLGTAVCLQLRREARLRRGPLSEKVYRGTAGMQLPFYVLCGMAFSLGAGSGAGSYWERLLPGMSALFVGISLFDLAMLCLLPLCRRRLLPGVTALLWLLPNVLYVFLNGVLPPYRPLWVIPVPAGPPTSSAGGGLRALPS